ncbi:MAG: hypothetical protein F6K50_23650 [Moorea sp. SIO3I7]|nr:hypothetical protein [Moorena sp. SIO3I7]
MSPRDDFNSQLQRLLLEAQNYPPKSSSRQLLVNQIVAMLMELPHNLRRQPVRCLPIVQQIYQALEEQLLQDVRQELDHDNWQRTSIREWANSLRNQALKKALRDPLLNSIALEAKQAPVGSNERKVALNLLMEAIHIANRLGHRHRDSLPPDIYNYVRNEALQNTLIEICQKIDNYHPNRDVMAWVNFLLNSKWIEVYNKYIRQGITHLPKHSNNHSEDSQPLTFVTSPDIIETFWGNDETISQSQELRQLIEEDPDHMFTQEHIRGRPDVNFKVLALAKIWEDKSWEELAIRFQIDSIQTLSSFYNRKLRKFKAYLQQYIEE